MYYIRLAVVSCLVSVAAAQAVVATYYVAPNGNDGHKGTVQQPWKTFRKGLSSLKPGDELVARGGLYKEILGGSTPVKIQPARATAPITVRAYPGERPVIQGLLWLSRPSYWTVDGINVTWQDGQSSRSHMVRLINGVGWQFINAEVWGAKSYAGILVGNTVESEPSNWRISGCTVHDTYASNSTNQDHLIYVNSSLTGGSGIVERNILYNVLNGNGVKLGGANNLQGTQNVTVRFNTFHNTKQGILTSWLSRNNLIHHNLFSVIGTNYGALRGFQLDGINNVARDNYIHDARYTILNDPDYLGILDSGRNFHASDPLFDFVGLGGFRPQATAAADYGRYATSSTTP
jgi:hypothetical protein